MMPTISVSEDVKQELLRFASELQMKLERRVDFDEAIKFLRRSRKGKNPKLLMVSNAGELPPYVLSEPGVNLSAHRAPIIQP